MGSSKNLNVKSLVLIDDSNLYYGFLKYEWQIDFIKFYNWLNKNFNILEIFFCGGIITKKAFFDMHPDKELVDFINEQDNRKRFFKFLKRTGYTVKTKPVSSLYDNTKGEYKRKCNFDVEITILSLDKLDYYKELVLCSGDGDFEKLLKYVKGKFKKTTIITHKDRLNRELRKTANRIIYLEDIKTDIQK